MEYLQPWDPEVLDVRGDEINMLILFASMFRNGKKSDAYVDCFIERVAPRLIVTFIDNSLSFHAIGIRHPTVKTLFAQNGWRGYFSDVFEMLDSMEPVERDALKVDYMLSFGPVIGSHYARYLKGSPVAAGSVKNNKMLKTHPMQSGLIAFASQWHSRGFHISSGFLSHEAFFEKPDQIVVQCLRRYADERNKRLAIIPRSAVADKARPDEAEYFRKLLGREYEFLEPEGLYPAYPAMDAAEVVVAIDSTLGYESIARGNKTAIFSIRSNMLGVAGWTFGWPGKFPEVGPFWTNRPSPDVFVQILDYLFDVDYAQWVRDAQASGVSSLMAYDPSNTILKSILEKELGRTPYQDSNAKQRFAADRPQGTHA